MAPLEVSIAPCTEVTLVVLEWFTGGGVDDESVVRRIWASITDCCGFELVWLKEAESYVLREVCYALVG